MAKLVVLLGLVFVSALLIFQDVAYARELTEANGGPGLKDEKLLGRIQGGGYFGGGYGGRYRFGYRGGFPPFGYGPGYIPFNGGGYGNFGFGGDYGGQPFYGFPFVNGLGN